MSAATTTARATTATGPGPATVLVLMSALPPLAADAYLPGLPAIAGDLGTNATGVQLTLTTFFLGMAAGHVLLGPIAARHGRRAPLLACLAVSALACVACALATGVATLAGARLVQGFAASACLLVGRAVVADRRGRQAAHLYGLLMAGLGVALILAPLAGGVLVAAVGWRAVFWALAVLFAAMIPAAMAAVPRAPAGLRRRPAAEAPDRPFLGYALAFVLAFGALAAYLAAFPFLLRDLFGLSAEALALVLAVNASGLVLAGIAGGHLVNAVPPHRLLEAGLAVTLAASAALCGLALAGALPLAAFLVLLFAAVSTLGLVLGGACGLALARAPRAAGTLGAAQFTAGAIAAALAGLGGGRDARPMALLMTGCLLVALAVVAAMRGVLDVTRREDLETGRIGAGSCDQPR
ncbi:Bcr/CflA family drug resistance efflux transporter [Sphaerisporangium krabiense]|uniref:DHA1 family bicyclomycin/chloramphenicol resistance-like MFS transporter n=1 Tax=Sphaerisporangium krabiense TaxID=763782 RepID=A0A7W8ZAZ8_9ACTN|nr:MFS transporter [Sphaerisporangium krabiense]MBB5630702.1 DHA1 family bicyclomycin/chloramphenicol resistance-like MFS transporter [Sphaerisporangium krabiense]GII67431.1 Bcr/CflA family drug resistance efflux transporter [Sphaerisporangium krabiense]